MTSHAFDVLQANEYPAELPAVVVAYGEDSFLRNEVLHSVAAHAKIDFQDCRSFDGEECAWLDVHDELATLSLFETGGRRVAVVKSADKLVKSSRPLLEKWFAAPAEGSLLLMQLASFPSNTKLFKTAAKSGWLINCSLPNGGGRSKAVDLARVKEWLLAWAKRRHDLNLKATQATLLLESVGTDCGILNQELSKLTLYADDQGALSADALRENLGTWRTRTMWEIADAIVDGDVPQALLQLDKVFAAGEHPSAVVPQIAWSLRRYGRAAQLILQAKRSGATVSASAAIGQSGFWGADARKAEQRIRRLGLKRASQILDWLLDLDLKIKGSHSHPARAKLALELLCLKFA